MFQLAVCYQRGEGVAADFEKALEWLSQAAERGNANAQVGLAKHYENGVGVPVNINKALQLYRSAAHAGNQEAVHELRHLTGERTQPAAGGLDTALPGALPGSAAHPPPAPALAASAETPAAGGLDTALSVVPPGSAAHPPPTPALAASAETPASRGLDTALPGASPESAAHPARTPVLALSAETVIDDVRKQTNREDDCELSENAIKMQPITNGNVLMHSATRPVLGDHRAATRRPELGDHRAAASALDSASAPASATTLAAAPKLARTRLPFSSGTAPSVPPWTLASPGPPGPPANATAHDVLKRADRDGGPETGDALLPAKRACYGQSAPPQARQPVTATGAAQPAVTGLLVGAAAGGCRECADLRLVIVNLQGRLEDLERQRSTVLQTGGTVPSGTTGAAASSESPDRSGDPTTPGELAGSSNAAGAGGTWRAPPALPGTHPAVPDRKATQALLRNARMRRERTANAGALSTKV